MEPKEPYRATKLWNEVIQAFKHGMPLKKHRRRMHTYSDCFLASDAVTWLHCYLMNNRNFGPDVTRQQTINLLGKFLKCHVIETVTSNKGKKCEFSDNSLLYRFTQLSPQQLRSCALQAVQPSFSSNEEEKAMKNKNLPKKIERSQNNVPGLCQKENIKECLYVERKMSLVEIEDVWKKSVLERLQGELGELKLSDIIDEEVVNGHVVKHNVSRISKTGVVTLIDKTDDIPHWVVSAMKCLANWPNASGSGSCLPNYPGFEKDVFKVVRDFFINPNVPLIPETISTPMSAIFCYFLQDQLKVLPGMRKINNPSESSSFEDKSASSEIQTSTPILCSESGNQSNIVSLCNSSHGKLLLDDPDVMWDYSTTAYYETDFACSDPVTKMVSTLSDSRTLIYDPLCGSMESVSTISICSIYSGERSVKQNHSFSPLKNWSSDSCLHSERNAGSLSLPLLRNQSSEDVALQRHSMFDHLSLPFADNDSLNDSVCSSKTLTPESIRNSVADHDEEKNDSCILSIDNQTSLSAIKNQHLSSPIPAYEASFISNCSTKFKNFSFPDKLKSSFQLLLLFLPPPNRRQLHLLFRVMNKILKNEQFTLDIKIPMSDYLMQTFMPAILPAGDNPSVMFGVVFFLLTNCELLLSPPSGLKEKVEEMCKVRFGKIVYSVDDACYLTYCEMVSKQQYEEQKVTMSHEALKNLLVSIVQNRSLSEKERKKRIKQFRENHPEVYYEFFPGKPSFQRSKSSFLNRFYNMRI